MTPASDTASKLLPAGLPAQLPRLVRTGFTNLRRDRASRVYFADAKVHGRRVRQSLKTKSKEIAKQRLDALLTQKRELWAGHTKPTVENWRMKQLFEVFRTEIAHSERKPRAKAYRLETLRQIERTWPELEAARPDAVAVADCVAWAGRVRKKYSASRYNGCVETLRMVFELAARRDLIARNPMVVARRRDGASAVGVRKARVLSKDKVLPTVQQMAALFRRMRALPSRRQAFWFVRVLAYSGQRPESVRTLYPQHVDLAENVVHWPPVKHNVASNPQPMHRQLRVVMRTLLRLHPGGNKPLLPIRSARKALATACREAGIVPALTEGVFRHWFTTQALVVAGIPVPVVALMRGDRDGGKMLLRTYNHPQMEQLRKQIGKM